MNRHEALLRVSLFSAYVHIADLDQGERDPLVDVLMRYAEELEEAILFGSSVYDALAKMGAEQ